MSPSPSPSLANGDTKRTRVRRIGSASCTFANRCSSSSSIDSRHEHEARTRFGWSGWRATGIAEPINYVLRIHKTEWRTYPASIETCYSLVERTRRSRDLISRRKNETRKRATALASDTRRDENRIATRHLVNETKLTPRRR